MASGYNKFSLLAEEDDVKKTSPKKKDTTKPTRDAAKAKAAAPRDAAKKTGSRPPARTHDRTSGTGRGREVRKDGAGKGGWGNKEVSADATPAADVAPVVEEPVVPAEPEIPVITLEDFQKEAATKMVEGDSKPIRAAIVNDSISNAKVLNTGKVAGAAKAKKSKKAASKFVSVDEFNATASKSESSRGPARTFKGKAEATAAFPEL